MRHITVEPSLGAKLIAHTDQVALCNDDGQILGFFSPLDEPVDLADLQLEPPLSIEETKKLCIHRTGRTLDEILREFNL
jgi:hypothetical protein